MEIFLSTKASLYWKNSSLDYLNIHSLNNFSQIIFLDLDWFNDIDVIVLQK